jgi:hypothetical protein
MGLGVDQRLTFPDIEQTSPRTPPLHKIASDPT